MRRLTLLLSVVVVVAVALGASGAASPSGSAKARWVITDLGTLGGKLSEAVAINELGHVVGNSADASGRERAFLWRDGKMITLRFGDPNWPREPGRANWAVGINDADQVIGEDASGLADRAVMWENGKVSKICFGRATAINERGQVIGTTTASSLPSHPFVWQNGTLTRLRLLGVGHGSANAINERGQVVGSLDTKHESRGHAILWQGKQPIDLGRGRGANVATGINDREQIVGGGHGIPSEAFLWQHGTLTDLGTLGGAHTDVVLVGDSYELSYSWKAPRTLITNRGQIIGSSETSRGDRHAFLWQDGRMRDLGTLPGRTESEAVALNNHGQLAANSFNSYYRHELVDEGSFRAFVWQNGKATDLGTLGGQQSAAIDINDHGQIVGWATTNTGRKHAVLWTLKPGM